MFTYVAYFAIAALLAVVCLAVWSKVSKRHKDAYHIAVLLRGFGLTDIPEVLEDYAAGDLPGCAVKLATMRRVYLKSPDAAAAEFKKVFDSCLEAKLSTPEGRAYVQTLLANATAPAK